MMAIVQKKMDVQRSINEMLQLVSISLTDTVELKALFCKPNCNIVNEPDSSTEPTFAYVSLLPDELAGYVLQESGVLEFNINSSNSH